MVRPSRRREMARKAVSEKLISIRLACFNFPVNDHCYRYQPKLDDDNAMVADWLVRLTDNNRNGGFGLCFPYLRNVQHLPYNHKRIYRKLELNLQIKPKPRLKRNASQPLRVPESINQVWSMDFMLDQLESGGAC